MIYSEHLTKGTISLGDFRDGEIKFFGSIVQNFGIADVSMSAARTGGYKFHTAVHFLSIYCTW